MMTTELNAQLTTLVAIMVLFLGKWLNARVAFLRSFNISEPVTGGLLASCLVAIAFVGFDVRFRFDLDFRDELLLIFFSTVGLSARLDTLVKGGKQLAVLLVLAVMYLVIQCGVGVGIALVSGIDPLIGVIGGSVSLSGGHGTAIAWTPIFRDSYGVTQAAEFGIASATFGLVLGGLLGGPVARFLIQRGSLKTEDTSTLTVGVEQDHDVAIPVDYDQFLLTLFIIGVTVGVGLLLDQILDSLGVQLPAFVSCLFVGIFVANTAPLLSRNPNLPRPEQSRSLALFADVSLGLFLAISLMSLELWTLADLGLPLVFILLAQVLVLVAWVVFVIFRAMGAAYDAAVISAGYLGLALGATPTAIANMTAVTTLSGPSPRAFIIIPLVGAFFIDIANTIVIQGFIGLLSG
ncbi:MAG: sodium/glutamate symporter [Pseudomonadota bacterium]